MSKHSEHAKKPYFTNLSQNEDITVEKKRREWGL